MSRQLKGQIEEIDATALILKELTLLDKQFTCIDGQLNNLSAEVERRERRAAVLRRALAELDEL